MKNTFIKRTLSGIVFALITLGATYLSEYSFALLVTVIGVCSLREFNRIAKSLGADPLRVYPAVVGIIAIAINFMIVYDLCDEVWILPVVPLTFAIFIIELYRKKENPFTNIAYAILGLVYIITPLCLLFNISIDNDIASQSVSYNPSVIISYFVILWANDVGAYLVGVSIGKHRLFERLSPKKSWEGFFGGLILAAGAAVLIGDAFDYSALKCVILAIIIVITGVFGDLIESMLKRSAGIKDSGKILPGHGGFLDRFDAMFVSAPYVFIYIEIINHNL